MKEQPWISQDAPVGKALGYWEAWVGKRMQDLEVTVRTRRKRPFEENWAGKMNGCDRTEGWN